MSERTAPRVTVLLTVYNDESFLSAAIDSVLAQTFRDFELLIVDDASTDGSRAIVERHRDPRVRLLIKDTNLGVGASANRGLATIRSEYVARLDSDDVCFPQRLEREVAWLDAHPKVAVVGSQATLINERGRTIGRAWRPVTDPGLRWWRIFGSPLIHSSVMFRRAIVWDELGGYRDMRFGEDFDLWNRLSGKYPIRNLSESLVAYRIRRNSLSLTPRLSARDEYRARKAPMIQANLQETLQSDDIPLHVIERWVEVTDSSRPQRDLEDVVAMIEQAAVRFSASYGENDEVHARQAWMLTRVFEKAPSLMVWKKIWRRDRKSALRAVARALIPSRS